MAETIAIIGASGKLGGATLAALLAHNLAPPASIVALTSSQPGSQTWKTLAAKGDGKVQVRRADFEDGASLEAALAGVHRLFLVSTPAIALDFADAPPGRGRERHHKAAIDAAVKAGVHHVYYSSLGFASAGGAAADHSKAGVMRAHLRTEAYLRQLRDEGTLGSTVIREGLYNESWPLYLGYFGVGPAGDDRTTVKLAGDGKICWTAIHDLGVASALVLVAPKEKYAGKTFYLSTSPDSAKNLKEVAAIVGEARGKEVQVQIVGREEHERHYIHDRGVDKLAVEWWASTYEALEDGECLIDDPTLEQLLSGIGLTPVTMEETVRKMIKGSSA
jgi:nucleoside-diphosphate-sugar epimerase